MRALLDKLPNEPSTLCSSPHFGRSVRVHDSESSRAGRLHEVL